MASLVYHAGALGDFITTLPAIARFAAAGDRLILLGKPSHARLVPRLFEEVWDAETGPFAALFSPSGAVPGPLGERVGRLTAALLFASARSPLASTLVRLGVRDVVRQDPFPVPPVPPVPVVDYHLSLFPGPFSEEERIPRLQIAPPDVPGGDIAFSFGSGSPKKDWPLERFVEVASALARRGEVVRWIEGPAEAGRSPAPRGQTWISLPLDQLVARLSRCRLFLGNDSGVTHLAAAAGCPTVALFGPSDQRIWSPRGKNVRVIASPSGNLDDIGTEDVLRTCLDFLEKK